MAIDVAERRHRVDRRSGTVDRRARRERRGESAPQLSATSADRRSHHDRRSAYPDRRLKLFDRRALPELVTTPPRRWDGSDPILPVLAVAVLSFLDVVTTARLAELGGVELNPVSDWLIDRGWLLTAKVLAVGTLAALVSRARPTRWIPLALWCVVGVYAGVIAVHAWQLAS